MSAPTVFVVTGANSGIGLAVVTSLASRADTVVYAGVRNNSVELDALVARSKGAVRLLAISSADVDGNRAAAAQVKKEIGYVNTLIANAGMAKDLVGVLESSPDYYEEQFRVNTLGPIVLYQSFYQLLVAKPNPVFMAVSTLGASLTIADQVPFKFPGYAASKAALNITIRALHSQTEQEGLTTFVVHPGVVDTMVADVIMETVKGVDVKALGYSSITPEVSAAGLLKVVGEATRSTHGGRFLSYDGTECPW